MLLLLAAFISTTGNDLVRIENRGPWAVYRVTDSMCLMASADPSGTVLGLLVDRAKSKNATLIVGNSSWSSLTQGGSSPVDFLADGSSFNTSTPVVQMVGGKPSVFAATQMWKVEKAFTNWASLAATYRGNILAIRYHNEHRLGAYQAARRCAGMGNDPFKQ